MKIVVIQKKRNRTTYITPARTRILATLLAGGGKWQVETRVFHIIIVKGDQAFILQRGWRRTVGNADV